MNVVNKETLYGGGVMSGGRGSSASSLVLNHGGEWW